MDIPLCAVSSRSRAGTSEGCSHFFYRLLDIKGGEDSIDNDLNHFRCTNTAVAPHVFPRIDDNQGLIAQHICSSKLFDAGPSLELNQDS